MSTKAVHYLTLDEAIARTEALIKKSGTGDIAFLMQSRDAQFFQHCALRLVRSGANSPYKIVSRGGKPGALATVTVEQMTADEAVARMRAMKDEAGSGDIPFLACNGSSKEMELCDLWLDRVGAKSPLKRVSRGGRDVIVVALTVPYKD
jgi:hypothetical protein